MQKMKQNARERYVFRLYWNMERNSLFEANQTFGT